MPQREIDSPSSDGAQPVACLLARIDGLIAQIASYAIRSHTRALPADSALSGRLRRKRRRSPACRYRPFRRPASKDWSSSRGSDTIQSGSFTAEVGRRCHHQDRRRRSGNMSFSESGLEWGDGMKCNPDRLFRCNPRTSAALKFSQMGYWGWRFISKSIGKK
jgi:hypothetical protein